ncbi:hypothetical protein AGLY_012718 [Aphis glycines]|uniref:Uncharacterized protein n=1 Tax=Aphis glycines TaxID=307491 RepID=A0A6G0TAK9_APHGL|nr:hypothetical protein AGLY_012718 [Aphis glycines]
MTDIVLPTLFTCAGYGTLLVICIVFLPSAIAGSLLTATDSFGLLTRTAIRVGLLTMVFDIVFSVNKPLLFSSCSLNSCHGDFSETCTPKLASFDDSVLESESIISTSSSESKISMLENCCCVCFNDDGHCKFNNAEYAEFICSVIGGCCCSLIKTEEVEGCWLVSDNMGCCSGQIKIKKSSIRSRNRCCRQFR